MLVADHLVLLGLDRRDDVAHALAARCVHRGQQRGVLVTSVALGRPAQHLVGEIEHPTSQGAELAATAHVLGVGPGRGVERPRHRCPPVQQQRFVVVLPVEEAQAPDVEMFSGNGFQPPEAQSVVGYVESVGFFGQGPHLGVAFHRGTAVFAQRGAVPVTHPDALGVQAGVEPVDIGLFGLYFDIVIVSWHVLSVPPWLGPASDCVPSPGPCRKAPGSR